MRSCHPDLSFWSKVACALSALQAADPILQRTAFFLLLSLNPRSSEVPLGVETWSHFTTASRSKALLQPGPLGSMTIDCTLKVVPRDLCLCF